MEKSTEFQQKNSNLGQKVPFQKAIPVFSPSTNFALNLPELYWMTHPRGSTHLAWIIYFYWSLFCMTASINLQFFMFSRLLLKKRRRCYQLTVHPPPPPPPKYLKRSSSDWKGKTRGDGTPVLSCLVKKLKLQSKRCAHKNTTS